MPGLLTERFSLTRVPSIMEDHPLLSQSTVGEGVDLPLACPRPTHAVQVCLGIGVLHAHLHAYFHAHQRICMYF